MRGGSTLIMDSLSLMNSFQDKKIKTMTRSVKKVLAIHDLCSHGRVSLKVVTPILTTMGFEVYPLPTALLSAHTQYPHFTFTDLTDTMLPMLESWSELGVTFDAVYTGYLGSPRQVDIVKEALRRFGSTLSEVVIDPVMGDNGRLYTGFDESLVSKMRELVERADVIAPNLTEVAYLLGEPYKNHYSDEEVVVLLKRLAAMGPRRVVITGVPVDGRKDRISVLAYDAELSRLYRVEEPFLPAHVPGTGDGFSSVLTGSLLSGATLAEAIDRAAGFIVEGIRATLDEGADPLDGMIMEPILPSLREPLPRLNTVVTNI